MSTKKAVKEIRRPNRALALITSGLVIIAAPVFILLAFYAYTLVFIGNDAATVAKGITILASMVIALGLVIFNRR